MGRLCLAGALAAAVAPGLWGCAAAGRLCGAAEALTGDACESRAWAISWSIDTRDLWTPPPVMPRDPRPGPPPGPSSGHGP